MKMSRLRAVCSIASTVSMWLLTTQVLTAAQPARPGTGTVQGHIRFEGKLPGNPVIRMGMDPKCAQTNAGKQVIQEIVAASLDGSLANVFVSLAGTFLQTEVPSQPVTIAQHGCVYLPRVVGVRVGQRLEVRNDDDLLHNVHSLSRVGNDFNVSEPKQGMVQQFRFINEEIMLRLKCDIHSWMTAYIAVVNHPYFDVSDAAGTFKIENVPVGTYVVQAWHERYGGVTKTVEVRAGKISAVESVYSGTRTESLPPGPHVPGDR